MLKPIFRERSYITRIERNQILEFLDTLKQTEEIKRLENLLQIPTSKQSYIDYVDRETIDLLIEDDMFVRAIKTVSTILDLNDPKVVKNLANYFIDILAD